MWRTPQTLEGVGAWSGKVTRKRLSSVLADVLSQPGPRGLGTEWAFLTKPVLPLRRRMLRLPPDTVVELPVDQLGLAVLTDMVASETWNSYNYIREAQEFGGLPQGEPTLAHGEAIAWLYARGLIALDPEQSAGQSMFVTRMGSGYAPSSPVG